MPRTSKNTVVTPEPGRIRITGHGLRVWLSDNYAHDWYRDAVAEARSGGDHNARRREIIYACCFAESFIFEWTRRKLQVEEINDYFPPVARFKRDPRYRRDLKEKWKQIPKELHKAGKIPSEPDLDLARLGQLLRYRHGLIHASGSRPATDGQPPEAKPFPTKRDLNSLKAGWAVSVAYDLVSELCAQLAEPKPDYLEKQ